MECSDFDSADFSCTRNMPFIETSTLKYINDSTSDIVSYPRQLDATFGTYFTNYLCGICCFIYGLLLYLPTIRLKVLKKSRGKKGIHHETRIDNVAKNQLCNIRKLVRSISASLITCGLMNVLSGFVHHHEQYVNPDLPPCTYGSAKDPKQINETDMDCLDEYDALRPFLVPWFMIWQMANISGSIFAGFMLFNAFLTIICESANFSKTSTTFRVTTKFQNNLYTASVFFGIFVLIQVVAHVWKAADYALGDLNSGTVSISTDGGSIVTHDKDYHIEIKSVEEKFKELWTLNIVIKSLAVSVLTYCVIVTTLCILHYKSPEFGNETTPSHSTHTARCSANTFGQDLLQPSRNESLSTQSSNNEEQTNNIDSTNLSTSFEVFQHDIEMHARQNRILIPLLRCMSMWTIFFSGVTQLIFAARCGVDDGKDCPLPKNFNHNAVFHTILTLGMTFWFFTEYVNYNQQAKFIREQIYKVQDKH
ncbi:uncharacterized protein LOC120342790 [Styela clava]